MRYSAEDGKAVVRRVSESERSVVRVSIRLSLCTSLLPQSVRLFLLCLTSLCFPFSLSSYHDHAWTAPASFRLSHELFHTSIASWLDQYHVVPGPFSLRSCTIFLHVDRLLDPGRISTTCLIVWGRDHRNCTHAIKVWRIYIYIYIYIHTNASWPHCTISSLELRRSAIMAVSPRKFYHSFFEKVTAQSLCSSLRCEQQWFVRHWSKLLWLCLSHN